MPNIRSRQGASEAVGYLISLPVMYIALGLFIVLAWWFWTLAANTASVSQGALTSGVGLNGESRRRQVVAAALGGFAEPYHNAQVQQDERWVMVSINHSYPVAGLMIDLDIMNVRARSFARREGFYGLPGDEWE
jgi:hypothetical protein